MHKAKVGSYPATAKDMAAWIPGSVAKRLTSSELAEMLDALDACARATKALHDRDICDQGCVWDDAQNKMRLLA